MKFSATITKQYDTAFSPFPPDEFTEALEWAKKSCLDGIEICISEYKGIDVPEIRKKLDETGLECSTISTGQALSREKICLLSQDMQLVEAAQKRLMEHIDAAEILGSKVTLGLLRGTGTEWEPDAALAALSLRMQPVVDYAEKKNVKILLEAINRYETSILNNAVETKRFVERDLGNPRCVGILWDVFHANIEDTDFSAAIDCLGDRLWHVHLADSNRAFPEYGHLDFTKIVRKLKEMGYDQYLSFECLNRPSRETVKEDMAGFVKKMREL